MDQAESSYAYNPEANRIFPSKEYLKRFSDPTGDPMRVHIKFLEAWHNFYQKHGGELGGSANLLEFGGGPTLHSLITASKHVRNITFSDYAESNRNEITLWKDKADERHDWSHYIKYVVAQMEGDTAEGALEKREEVLRQKITEIIPCNLRNSGSIVPETKFSSFDIVQTNLCLEIACDSVDEFKKTVCKLGKLLKPGGYLLCLTAKGGAWYTCAGGGDKMHQLKMAEEDILTAFKEASELTLVESYNIEPLQNPLSATKSFQFTIAQKK